MATRTSSPSIPQETLLGWYRDMVLVRIFEEKCRYLYFEEKDRSRKITGVYLHLASGHEATHVGAVKALGPDDHVITAYRDHGIALARGIDPKPLMAEMMGKRTGVSGGKGGSMHLASREKNFWGGYAIVGGHLPLAAGIALKVKYMSEPNAVLCFLGDGASNNGYFHEAVNMSAVLRLPIVWLIENNLVGMGTRVEQSSGQPILVKRAIAYGIQEGPRVDGQDVVQVQEAVAEAIDYCKSNGPVLMEALTYRYDGHGVSDKQFNAREDLKSELQEWLERDPLEVTKRQLLAQDKKVEAELGRIDEECTRLVDEAVEYAVNSENPNFDDLVSNIYVNTSFPVHAVGGIPSVSQAGPSNPAAQTRTPDKHQTG